MVDGEKAATTYTIGWKPQPGPQTALLASAETSAAGVAVFHRALISAIFKKVETLLDAVSPR